MPQYGEWSMWYRGGRIQSTLKLCLSPTLSTASAADSLPSPLPRHSTNDSAQSTKMSPQFPSGAYPPTAPDDVDDAARAAYRAAPARSTRQQAEQRRGARLCSYYKCSESADWRRTEFIRKNLTPSRVELMLGNKIFSRLSRDLCGDTDHNGSSPTAKGIQNPQ